MNLTSYKREIERIIQIARNKYAEITDEVLDANGIYYMNGNDGTLFDWEYNNRLCEFYVFYKSGIGFIKACVFSDNIVRVYIYEDGGFDPVCKFTEDLKDVSASDFAKVMHSIADNRLAWDEPIDSLNWEV